MSYRDKITETLNNINESLFVKTNQHQNIHTYSLVLSDIGLKLVVHLNKDQSVHKYNVTYANTIKEFESYIEVETFIFKILKQLRSSIQSLIPAPKRRRKKGK